MNRVTCLAALLTLCAASAFAGVTPAITGDYLEVRTCDVYTGSCFANAEMDLTGKEAMLVWSVRAGAWNGVDLDGLNVIAVVRTAGTLGDLNYDPQSGKAVLVVDARATEAQRNALVAFAKSMAGGLISEVVRVEARPVEAKLGTCNQSGCASVKAGELVEITTKCLDLSHKICGNEETFYPPLIDVAGAYPVLTGHAAFRGDGLGKTWESVDERSAFLASFAR